MTIYIDLSKVGDPTEPFNNDAILAIGKALGAYTRGELKDEATYDGDLNEMPSDTTSDNQNSGGESSSSDINESQGDN